MPFNDAAIVGYAEAKSSVRSGRDVRDFAGEILDALLQRTGLDRAEIEGIIMTPSQTAAQTAFRVQTTVEFLGLQVNFADTTDLGGLLGGGRRRAGCGGTGYRLVRNDRPNQCRYTDHSGYVAFTLLP
ncbi:MAG TPA: hypothetical protein VGL34_15215 [Steroidobacteraceae bacterium]|jgi:hypothetical protein